MPATKQKTAATDGERERASDSAMDLAGLLDTMAAD